MNTFLMKMDKASSPWLRVGILETTLLREDALFIIKSSFNDLSKRDYFNYINQKIFLFLVDYPEDAKDEILYLLNSNNSILHLISPKQLGSLINSIPEVIDLVMARFIEMDLNSQELVQTLTNATLHDEKKFMLLAKKIFESSTVSAIKNFIKSLAYINDFDNYSILKPLIYAKGISSVPSTMSDCVYLDDSLRNFLVDNFDELYSIEKFKRMNFIDNLKYDLPDEVKEKYDYLIKLVMASNVSRSIIERLNILLANNGEDFIKDYIGDEKVTYLPPGSTAQVFKIGEEKVLKFASMKHIPASIFEHFLLAPTKRKIVTDSLRKPILYVEKQNFLKQVYNGIPINSDDYDNFFLEAKKQGLIISDPHCIRRYADNFGFLNDYHEATLVGVSNHEELPDWFKRRPFVLLDIDMVLRKDYKNINKKRTLK